MVVNNIYMKIIAELQEKRQLFSVIEQKSPILPDARIFINGFFLLCLFELHQFFAEVLVG